MDDSLSDAQEFWKYVKITECFRNKAAQLEVRHDSSSTPVVIVASGQRKRRTVRIQVILVRTISDDETSAQRPTLAPSQQDIRACIDSHDGALNMAFREHSVPEAASLFLKRGHLHNTSGEIDPLHELGPWKEQRTCLCYFSRRVHDCASSTSTMQYKTSRIDRLFFGPPQAGSGCDRTIIGYQLSRPSREQRIRVIAVLTSTDMISCQQMEYNGRFLEQELFSSIATVVPSSSSEGSNLLGRARESPHEESIQFQLSAFHDISDDTEDSNE